VTLPIMTGDDALGAAIRRLRKTRGWTLVRLAEATALSHPFLSQIERGLAQPSLGSLRRIAFALETSPIELIASADDDATAADVEVHHRGEGALAAEFAAGSARMLVAGARPFHPMHLEPDSPEPGEYFVHREDEFVYVLDGCVRADIAGEVRDLRAGDSAYYRGGVAHRWWSADGSPMRMLVVKQGPTAPHPAAGSSLRQARARRVAPHTVSTAPRAL
jgi:transcriptional regulator with XRE-family HTH domain